MKKNAEQKFTYDTEEEYRKAIAELRGKRDFIEKETQRMIADEHLHREKKSLGLTRLSTYHCVPVKWADTVFFDKRYRNKFIKQTSCSLRDIPALLPDFEYHIPLYIQEMHQTCDNTYTLMLSDPYGNVTATNVHIDKDLIAGYRDHIAYCTIAKVTSPSDPSQYNVKVTSITPKAYGLYGHNNETRIDEREKAAKANPHPIYNAFAEPPEVAHENTISSRLYRLSDYRWDIGCLPAEKIGTTEENITTLWVMNNETVASETIHDRKFCTVYLYPIGDAYSPRQEDLDLTNNLYNLYRRTDENGKISKRYEPDKLMSIYRAAKKGKEIAKLQKFRQVIKYKKIPYLSDEELQYFTLKYVKENFSGEMTETEAIRAINNIQSYVRSHNITRNEKNFAQHNGYTVPMMDRVSDSLMKHEEVNRITWGEDFREGYPYFDVKEYSETECHILVSCIQKATPTKDTYAVALDAKLRYLLRDDALSLEKRNEFLRNDLTNYLDRLRSHAISKRSIMDFAATLPDADKIIEHAKSNDLPIGTDEEKEYFQNYIDEDAKLDYYPPKLYIKEAPSYIDTTAPHKKDPLAFLYRRLPYKMITIKYSQKDQCLMYAESTQFYYNSMRPVIAAKYDKETIDRIGTKAGCFYADTAFPKNFEETTGFENNPLNVFIYYEYRVDIADLTLWFFDKYMADNKNILKRSDIKEEQIEELYRNSAGIPKGKPINKDIDYAIFKESYIKRQTGYSHIDTAEAILGGGTIFDFLKVDDFSDDGPFGKHPKWLNGESAYIREQYYLARKNAGLDSFSRYRDTYLELISIQSEYVEKFKEFDTKYGMIDYVPFVANLKEATYLKLADRMQKASE